MSNNKRFALLSGLSGAVLGTASSRLSERRSRRQRELQSARRRAFAAGIAAGVAGMYVLDPRNGKRRRALARDKVAKLRTSTRNVVQQKVPNQFRYAVNSAKGLTTRANPMKGQAQTGVEDQTITDRVMSTAFRGMDIATGQINVNTVDQVVYLRGSMQDQAMVDQIEQSVRKVAGVREVVNLINQPHLDPSAVRSDMDAQTG